MEVATQRQLPSSFSSSSFYSRKGASAAAGFNEAREDVARSNYRDLSTLLEEGVCRVSADKILRWSARPLFIVGIDVPDTRDAALSTTTMTTTAAVGIILPHQGDTSSVLLAGDKFNDE